MARFNYRLRPASSQREIQMDDNGFLGLSTDLSVNDIELILLANNFEIER